MTITKSYLNKVMHERKSVRKYEANYKIPQAELEELLVEATTAPSSSNLQPWRFLVIQDEAVKKELRSIANNQEQVETASAIIAVLGDTEMYKNVEEVYTKNFELGYMDEATKNVMIENSLRLYPNLPKEVLKNIATFDAGLISMQIMLLAKDMGYDTVPMAGFNKEAFAKRFELTDNLVPIVLIAIGKAAAPAYGSSRLELNDIAKFI
ncbi:MULTISPECIES: nitroreductase family protein [unclassified Lysinibacillus]|uniref:nitroreductase family protein n=1 Tax=unclassified Lysinibacillus TaxID=2636778 RepID=UPI0025550FA7|nr:MULTISPECIES: nitroreductase family protein [unclassified Lysinibacillus]MDM5247513.1 nitroreductase family protein [Lysinibacillus sp. G4S2]